jgi:hypothetical protein
MSAASESNDASDIFWPGYVDAVTNLAINLLFVIAVMSIVVISTIMQISKMKPEQVKPEDKAVVSKPRSTMENEKKGNPESLKAEQASKQQANQSQSIEKIVLEKTMAEQKVVEQSKQLTKLQKELETLKQGQAKQKNEPGKSQDINTPSEVVKATENRQKTKTGQNQFLQMDSGGVVIVFDKDVLRLSDAEAAEFISKVSAQANLSTFVFELKVVTPKGFSESSRIAYYRLNEIRNVLIKNGSKPENITMRVVESESQSANNSRILVRPIQP